METVLFKVAADVSSLDKDMAKAESIVSRRIQSTLKGRSRQEQQLARERLALDDQINRKIVNNDMVRHQIRMRRIAAENRAIAAGSGGFGWIGGSGAKAAAGTGGHGHGNMGMARESMVMVRELARGDIKSALRSGSVMLGMMGKLGTVLSMVMSPFAGVVGGAALGLGSIYGIGRNAAQTVRQSRQLGFSTSGFQTVLQQASRESGGKEAALEGMAALSQSVGGARTGSESDFKKFQRHGIALSKNGSALTNEQIYGEVLAKLEGTSDPAKKAAIALDMFGASYKKFLKTIDEGKTGFDSAMGKSNRYSQTAGQLSIWETLGNTISDTASGAWHGTKKVAGSVWNAAKSGYIGYAKMINPNLRRLSDATEQGIAIDEKIRAMEQSGRIKTHALPESKLAELNPELAANLKQSRMQNEDMRSVQSDYMGGKVDLGTMAEQARKMTGLIHRRNYSVTPRMRTALKIEDLEEQAKVAYERGDDSKAQSLMKQATDLRSASPWLKNMDRSPMRKTEEQLIQANQSLKVVESMAKMVLETKQ